MTSSSRADAVRRGLTEALGEDPGPITFDPTGGGCINSAALIAAGGETFFVKWNDHPLPRQFEVEAAGLSALADADTPLCVPRPVAYNDEGPGTSFLVVEYVPPGRRGPRFAEDLGRGLAALHQSTTEEGFGFSLDGYCGATPQPNGWMSSWVDFYAERRLGHQLRLAREGGLSSSDARVIEAVIDRLPALIDDDEPPALLHGDLWSGNLHVTPEGDPALIDPAAYYGHREAELGMMALFGGFPEATWAAYDEARPLRPGWRERLGLYELYHLLNHLNLFGGGYRHQALSVAKRYQ